MSFVFGYGGSINDIKTGIDKKTENIVTTNPAPSNVGNIASNVGIKVNESNIPVSADIKPISVGVGNTIGTGGMGTGAGGVGGIGTGAGNINKGTDKKTPVNNGTEGHFDQGGSNDLPPTPTADFMFEFQGGTDDTVAHFAKIIIKVEKDILNGIIKDGAGYIGLKAAAGDVKSAMIALPFNHAENLTESMTVTYNRLTDNKFILGTSEYVGDKLGDLGRAMVRRIKVQYDPSGLNKKLSIPFLVYVNNRTTLEDLKKCISFLEALLYPVGMGATMPPPISVSIGKLYSAFEGNLAGVSVRYDSAWTTDSESPAFLDDQAYPMFAYGTLDFINLELYDWSELNYNLSLSRDTRILFGEVLNGNSAIGETFSGEVGSSGPPTTETFPKSDNKKDNTPSIQPKPIASKKEPATLLDQSTKDDKMDKIINNPDSNTGIGNGKDISVDKNKVDSLLTNNGIPPISNIDSNSNNSIIGNNTGYAGLTREGMREEIKENIKDVNDRTGISVNSPSIEENNDINELIGGFE